MTVTKLTTIELLFTMKKNVVVTMVTVRSSLHMSQSSSLDGTSASALHGYL